jgi:hypothetical protein
MAPPFPRNTGPGEIRSKPRAVRAVIRKSLKLLIDFTDSDVRQ